MLLVKSLVIHKFGLTQFTGSAKAKMNKFFVCDPAVKIQKITD